MADCAFCGSGIDVEAQDMGEGRTMMLCASCRANITAGEERDTLCDHQWAMMWNPFNSVTQCHRCGQLAEVERLRAREAALMAVITQVVASNDEHGDGARCHFCGFTPDIALGHGHALECRREQARALLASSPAQTPDATTAAE